MNNMRIFLFVGTIDALMSIIGYMYYRHYLPFGRTLTFGLIYLLMALGTAISVILPQGTPHFLLKLTAWIEGLWIAFCYYTLLLAIIHLLCLLFSKLGGWQLPSAKISIIGLAFICCFITWGSWRAFHPTVRTEALVTEKLPQNAHYKIVFLTDLHMGRILGHDYAERLAARINEQKPDFVVVSGDMLDERIFYVEEEDTLSALAQIKAPVYMAFGNHDYLDEPLRWQQMLTDKGFYILRNTDTIIDNKIKITGIDDYSKNRTNNQLINLSSQNEDYYSILLDHQPRRMDAAAAAGYDLYLAGHTHTGQLFPNRLVTKKMYKLDYGRTNFGNLTAITNNGYGFWGPPVRTEIAPEWLYWSCGENNFCRIKLSKKIHSRLI